MDGDDGLETLSSKQQCLASSNQNSKEETNKFSFGGSISSTKFGAIGNLYTAVVGKH